MENREVTSIYENIENARLCENTNLEEGEYNQINEDLLLMGWKSPENSCTDSLFTQHEYDGGDKMDSPQQEEQLKEMPLLSPRQGDENMDWMALGSKVLGLSDFHLKKTQTTYQTFPITIKFPCNKNLEENSNFPKEEYNIFLIVKNGAVKVFYNWKQPGQARNCVFCKQLTAFYEVDVIKATASSV